MSKHHALLATARQAIKNADYAALEGMRDQQLAEVVEPFLSDYNKATDWPTRDAIVFLLQDVDDERLAPALRNALDSPTVETRAIAVSVLSGDRGMYARFIVNGFVDSKRVDAAISEYRTVKK
jgi:HEAT repeat protein